MNVRTRRERKLVQSLRRYGRPCWFYTRNQVGGPVANRRKAAQLKREVEKRFRELGYPNVRLHIPLMTRHYRVKSPEERELLRRLEVKE